MPTRHATDDLLLAYAAGALSESESLLVACHLALCPACRTVVSDAELLGVHLMQRSARSESVPPKVPLQMPGEVPDMDTLLQRFWDQSTGTEDQRALPAFDPSGVLPAPLYGRVGALDKAPWRYMFPGAEEVDLPGSADGKLVKLLRLEPGMKVPEHAHTGLEGILVLAGGFRDDTGAFERGDVSLRYGESTHEQNVFEDEGCIWLLVADGPVILL